MTHIRIIGEDDFTQVQNIDDEGRVSAAIPIPYYVRDWLFRWRPVCTVHKLIFKTDNGWYQHYTEECRKSGFGIEPEHIRFFKGYKKVRQ